ncbi:hypothetical protein TRVA0_084S00188 [Trichomonascus vanleenenianus]|uniref:uncharacterized protein n=1 Tax=Trichomonascus vanleenenianus TaxID=2268995 RepID=UPI003ECB036F
MGILEVIRDRELLILIGIGITYSAESVLLSQVEWWNSGSRRFRKAEEPEEPEPPVTSKRQIPVDALDKFYSDGGPDIQYSAVKLLKQFYLSNSEAIGLVRQNLRSPIVQDRRSGLAVLYGLIQEEPTDSRVHIVDDKTVEAIMDGMFESLDSATRASDEEGVYRKEALSFIQMLGRGEANAFFLREIDSPFMLSFIHHGLFDFFVEYDLLADIDKHLTSLDELTDPMSGKFQTSYSKALMFLLIDNKRCRLNMIDYATASRPAWRRAMAIAEDACVAGGLVCNHYN